METKKNPTKNIAKMGILNIFFNENDFVGAVDDFVESEGTILYVRCI